VSTQTKISTDQSRGGFDADRVAALPEARTYHLGRWAVSIIVVLLVALFVRVLATNPSLDWGVVAQYLFNPTVMDGVKNTIVITVLAELIGIAGGLLLALGRLSANPVLRVGASAYIWLFRGVPVLVQLIFWFNLGLVFPSLTIQVPWTSITLISIPTNSAITPFVAVLLGLGLNEMAYMAEIIRGGLLGVPPGQREAAASDAPQSRVATGWTPDHPAHQQSVDHHAQDLCSGQRRHLSGSSNVRTVDLLGEPANARTAHRCQHLVRRPHHRVHTRSVRAGTTDG
jgi:His/Glu/Gln/Arg/opine family amino acid ABC transporter permease subunit